MSLTLERARHWLKLLVDDHTSLEQAKHLLQTATPYQIRALVEILHNLQHNQDLPVPQVIRKRLSQKKWKAIGKRGKSTKSNYRAIQKWKMHILTVLHTISPIVLEILKACRMCRNL